MSQTTITGDETLSKHIHDLEVEFEIAVMNHRKGAVWWYLAIVAYFVLTFMAAIDLERLSRMVAVCWDVAENTLGMAQSSQESTSRILAASAVSTVNSRRCFRRS